ncbi:SPFH domain / Band 7 family protein [Nocardioides dokdonensis FR1436]|uniref:SPFH domain / Band 7 family protein n=1 Tax=Nocardioides dokdonensis FR1436 TaxID=1300347 RepID=A0A1A9GP76_9ACTN|nr:SPFH domain-containing protein [Nocardioides dokdonensis]ANH39886.1 SPFH domain / Band 7 family protein [Nocardioides dokdonensis FR1436]
MDLLGTVLVVLAVLVAAAVVVQLSLVRVPAGHRGELIGRPGTVLEPGLSWRWFGSQAVHTVDLRPRELVRSGEPLITADNIMVAARVRLVVAPDQREEDVLLGRGVADADLDVLDALAVAFLRQVVGETPTEQLLAQQREVGERLAELLRLAPVSVSVTSELRIDRDDPRAALSLDRRTVRVLDLPGRAVPAPGG